MTFDAGALEELIDLLRAFLFVLRQCRRGEKRKRYSEPKAMGNPEGPTVHA
jgi:hypothetical protein